MKNFDKLIVPPCEDAVEQLNAQTACSGRDPRCDDPEFAAANPAVCGVDPRCSNPDFAEAHPEICGPSLSQLVLKPSATVLCKDKSFQLHTYIRLGTNETEVTTGLTYRSSDQSVATVGAIGGNVSGLSEGVATISVEWMGKYAYANIQVKPTTDCCADILNRIVILTDISKSMSVAFGGTYANKLNFAKAAAVKFVNGVDLTKDSVALYSFSEAVTMVRDFSTDNADLLNGIAGLATTAQKTNIYEGLEEAIQAVNDVAVPGARKVIVIISDFENKLGGDPVPLAEAFFESGGIIIVVGVRANGAGYVLGNRLATGGFFINSYPAAAELALSSLDGVKAYFCSGACIPEGDVYASRAALDFDDFTQWDTVGAGLPDLIGAGSDGVQLADLIPGNGLYLDGCGTAPDFDAWIQTKDSFTFVIGKTYRLTIRVAGNQRYDDVDGRWYVSLGSVLIDQAITRTWMQNFTDEIIEFTVGFSVVAPLSLRYENLTSDTGNKQKVGLLLDLVKIENLTDVVPMFLETWDNENLQYIPPGCGPGTIEQPGGGYAYGYDCNPSDCLNIPPDTQKPDPIIAPDIEVADPPTIYTATKSAVATCPAGTVGSSVTRLATATSIVSQAAADAAALAAATLLAETDLVCTRAPAVGDIINIHFRSTYGKVGFAATGVSSSDRWNLHKYDAGNLKYTDWSLSGARLVFTEFPDSDLDTNYNYADRMMQWYAFLAVPTNPKIGGLAVGTYDIYVYARGRNADQNSTFQARVGSYNEVTFTPDSATSAETTGTGPVSDPWVEGDQYVKFTVVIPTAGKWVELLHTAGASGDFILNGIQIQRTS